MENIKRIVVADTGTEFRKSVVRTLNDEPGLRVIGETGDGSELLHMVRDLQPDAVVMELVLTGGMDGLDVLEEFAQLQSRPRVLILSSYMKGSMVDTAAAKGADFYMTKPCRISSVGERLRQIMAPGGLEPEQDDTATLEARHHPRDRRARPHQGLPVPAGGHHHCRQRYGCHQRRDQGALS